jgi:hypothetical protein
MLNGENKYSQFYLKKKTYWQVVTKVMLGRLSVDSFFFFYISEIHSIPVLAWIG